jgi:hypothetical protein
MAYTTIKKPSDYFNTKLYTGNGSTQSITGIGHQPDLVWTKGRNDTYSQMWVDAVRGGTKYLYSDTAVAEATNANAITSFISDGYNIGSFGTLNDNSQAYVSWNWKETATAGFDIVSYTGNGSAGKTVAHNLSAVPQMIIVKRLDTGSSSWMVYHHKLGTTNPSDKYLSLDTTAAQDNGGWNSTMPTSSVFTVSADQRVNANGASYIAYVFSEKQGYSKFGSYTGNGSTDGTFVYTGFKPAFVIIKNTGATVNWLLKDNKRPSYQNINDTNIYPNVNAVEETSNDTDFLSNGFKARNTGSYQNASGNNYIYMAFASEPLVGDNPATAR